MTPAPHVQVPRELAQSIVNELDMCQLCFNAQCKQSDLLFDLASRLRACLSGEGGNHQRGIGDGDIVAALNERDQYQAELGRCFKLAQLLDSRDPEAPGAFTGSVSERLARHMDSTRPVSGREGEA